jgi:hypothetical protein
MEGWRDKETEGGSDEGMEGKKEGVKERHRDGGAKGQKRKPLLKN